MVHFDIAIRSGGARLWGRGRGCRIQEARFVGMRSYNSNAIAISRGQVRVYEDEKIGESCRKRERRGEVRPSVWIGI
jgi:hypothetical protein